MNLTKASDVAEILSSIAVVLTLVYLAVEVTQNTNALQAQSRETVLTASHDDLYMLFENPRIVLNAISIDSITPEEQVQFSAHFTKVLRTREFSWLQYQDGLIDEGQWLTEMAVLQFVMDSPHVRDWWQESGRLGLSPDFRAFVEVYLAESEATGKAFSSMPT
jgi:hypothetical protein